MFNDFKLAVQRQFAGMKDQDLFRVHVDKDHLWNTYLSAFPAGTNPLFKTRTEHDCQVCRHFIGNMGNVVAIHDKSNKLISLWDVKVDGFYQDVAEALAKIVKAAPIENAFLYGEKTAGLDRNFQLLGSEVVTWDHFSLQIPSKYQIDSKELDTKLGELRTTKAVLLRGLQEITLDSLDTVLELIGQNSLYRGNEHTNLVTAFRTLKIQFSKLPGTTEWDPYAWSQSRKTTDAVSHIRSSVIGSLLIDLSEGKELDAAVASFESKVAPTNYKRPTAVVSKGMIEDARKKVIELGLTASLDRRYATLDDIPVTNTLFVNRNVRKKVTSDVFDVLAESTPVQPKNFGKVEEVAIDKFIVDILPTITTLEVLFENRHASNLVSLIAPADPTAKHMFKWPNAFSWSYTGDLADSDIRQAVQAQGGRVDGVFRFSHSWNHEKRNASLMDLHVFMPGNGTKAVNGINGIHDSYGNKDRVGWNHRNHDASGGTQDVDYTGAAPVGYVPVENITFPSVERMPEGTYICKIHNWNFRHPTEGGFRAEIEFGGQLFQYTYDKPLAHHEWVTVAEVTLKDKQFTIKHHLPESTHKKILWGLTTQTYQEVSLVLFSPNYWDEQTVGNKHHFFILKTAVNDGKARGFYNEFLEESLTPHRKVLELVGSKMRTDESEQQLSGLGFSSTQRNSIFAKVTGQFTRTIKITF